jgi:hypothetical protein
MAVLIEAVQWPQLIWNIEFHLALILTTLKKFPVRERSAEHIFCYALTFPLVEPHPSNARRTITPKTFTSP